MANMLAKSGNALPYTWPTRRPTRCPVAPITWKFPGVWGDGLRLHWPTPLPRCPKHLDGVGTKGHGNMQWQHANYVGHV